MNKIFTIGHSSHSIKNFVYLLRKFQINCIVDVRSIPFSKYVPYFNRSFVKTLLNIEGIEYIYMADELGGKSDDPELFSSEGYLDYEKVNKTEKFKTGIERLKNGILKGYTIAVMCTEKDPADCHRSIMITRVLSDDGYEVIHILSNGSTETQKELEDRLIKLYFPQGNQQNLFGLIDEKIPRSEVVNKVYNMRNRDIGFRIDKKARH